MFIVYARDDGNDDNDGDGYRIGICCSTRRKKRKKRKKITETEETEDTLNDSKVIITVTDGLTRFVAHLFFVEYTNELSSDEEHLKIVFSPPFKIVNSYTAIYDECVVCHHAETVRN